MKSTFEKLISIHLVEEKADELSTNDDSGHYLWRWIYPTIDSNIRSLIEKQLLSRTCLQTFNQNSFGLGNFAFYNIKSSWIYIFVSQRSSTDNNRFAFVLLTTDFYPHSYLKLLSAFAELYQRGTLLMRLLHYYLTLMIENKIVIRELNDLHYNIDQIEPGDTLDKSSQSQIRSIIKLFHLDVILVYTALLLKRRIVVYHHSQSTLLDFITALPLFVQHRTHCSHNILVPNVDLQSAEQIDDLKDRDHFVATFQDSKIEEKEDLYDIYINLAAVEITISRNSRDVFSMTKTHKEVAIAFVRVAENDSYADIDVVNEIAKKTSELINSIGLNSNDSNDSLDAKREIVDPKTKSDKISKSKFKLLSPNLELFYWNLALAEGIAETNNCQYEKISP